MHAADSQMALWLASALFWVGVMLIPLGVMLLVFPEKAARLAGHLNHWVSTRAFFDAINRPRYQERLIYRHHYASGGAIVVLASISLYLLVFYAGPETTAGYFLALAGSAFERWLFVNFYYLLVLLLALAALVGLVIFFRPSALKKLEVWSNRWIASEEKLRPLDELHDIPGNIFAEKPRLFGVFVLLGAAYIVYMTAGTVF